MSHDKKVDEILDQIFQLPVSEFYLFMKKLQEKMIKYQQDIE